MALMQLTLGPVLYLWDTGSWLDFYRRIADEADVDTVVLGEVVCSKRTHFHEQHLDPLIDRLRRGGKAVRLASLALITLAREQRGTRDLARRDDLEIEANDIAAHRALAGRRHAIGPFVNVYNAATARVLARRGASSICLPPELPAPALAGIASALPEIEFEVFAFGRVPLAISARCAHARRRGLSKDNCRFVCGEDPDGLPVETLDRQPFLALNGVQTLSGSYRSLLGELSALAKLGIRRFRLSPQRCDMVAVAEVFRAAGSGRLDPAAAQRQLAGLCPHVAFSNGAVYGYEDHRYIAGLEPLSGTPAGSPDGP
ncbi:MAG TPA: U32 family peptidase [Alphaproteobacteria bacterium]|nr:U32 family peptidase [Alphaproteobacteria bacterium]